MRLNFRRIGQFCLLLVIIGFFCPIACDANGFQIANGGSADPELIFALYGLFIAAIIGFIVGVVLMVNNKVPIIIDWLVTLTCMGCGLIPFFVNVNQWGRAYQSGAYLILIGIILSFVFLLIASFMGDTDYSNNATPINRNYGDTWVCKKCNERNPITSPSCKSCGEYK
jgi:ribosomal protein L40E